MGQYFTVEYSCSPRSQGRQTLLIFWWTKYVQSNRISVYSERMHTRQLGPTANAQVPGTSGTIGTLGEF